MPTLKLQGTEISYNENDIVTFPEGLIGLPHLRRMAIVRHTTIDPLLWLVSLDDDGVAFVLADGPSLFPGYSPLPSTGTEFRNNLGVDEKPTVLAIVLIAPEWQRSTVNLRAPLFISASNMTGSQIVLTDTSYGVGEPFPMAVAA